MSATLLELEQLRSDLTLVDSMLKIRSEDLTAQGQNDYARRILAARRTLGFSMERADCLSDFEDPGVPLARISRCSNEWDQRLWDDAHHFDGGSSPELPENKLQ